MNKNFHYIDFPKHVPLELYYDSIERMKNILLLNPNVFSIYQIGGISMPGISDLDLVVVMNDDSYYHKNPIKDLTKDEKYLFIHNLYGVSTSLFKEAKKFTFFHNYKLLFGHEFSFDRNECSVDNLTLLKEQIAIEFLLKMYITNCIQRVYGVVKIRSLLLHCKGLLYDMEFLNQNSGNLYELICIMIGKREKWFDSEFKPHFFNKWLNDFHLELKKFLSSWLLEKAFFLTNGKPIKVANNISLIPGKEFTYHHKGYSLPKFWLTKSEKIIRLQNRFNTFEFYVPSKLENIPEVIEQQFKLTFKMKSYNSKFFPDFYPLVSSLNAK